MADEQVLDEGSEEDILKQLTPEELYELQQFTRGGLSAPSPPEAFNVHKFLHDVVVSKDTTKTGYLEAAEVGVPDLPLRSLKELALYGEQIGYKDPVAVFLGKYFRAKAEIITSTSLSKDAKLLELAVVTRRELGDVTRRPKKKNKGWFSKKGEKGGDEQ